MKKRLVGWVLAAAVVSVAIARATAADAPATRPAGGKMSETDGAAEVDNGVSRAGEATFRLKFATGGNIPSMNEVKGLVESLRWRPAGSDGVVRWRVTRYTPLDGEAIVVCEQQVIGNSTGFVNYDNGAPMVEQSGADAAENALIAGLRQKLTSDGSPGAKMVERVKEIDARLADVRAMRGTLEAMARSQPPREEVMGERVKTLRSERERLELSLGAKEARQKALEAAIGSERDRVEARQAKDPIAEELRGVMKLREDEVRTVEAMHKNGVSTAVDLAEARAKLADARIKVAERESAVGKAGKGEILDRLADEMTMTTVDVTDLRLQLGAVATELGQLNPASATTQSLLAVVHDGTVPAGAGMMPPLYGELTKEEKALTREKLVLEVDGVEVAK